MAWRGGLGVRRDPDAEVAAPLPTLCLLGAKGVVVEGGEGRLEGFERRDAVVGHADRVSEWQVVVAQQVAAAQLGGIDADPAGGDVDEHLARQRLELPGPAIGSAPDGVRIEGLGRERGLRHAVGTGEDGPDGRRRHDRPRRRICAAVLLEVDAHGLDGAVGVERHRHVRVFMPR